ncbi:nicotinate-nucleotide diphosphorylase [Corynebacterium urogenitale]
MVSRPALPVPEALRDEELIRKHFERMARAGLEEDLGYGPDLTTLSTIAKNQVGRRVLRSRASGVLSGLDAISVLLEVAAEPEWDLGGTVEFRTALSNGDRVRPGTEVAVLEGDLRAMLQLERSMLNIVSHASAIATHTAQWVERLPEGVVVRDSRKTLPGLRMLQKRAVVHGGGAPHRWALGDQVMVKDNHVLSQAGLSQAGLSQTDHLQTGSGAEDAGDVVAAYKLVQHCGQWIEVEVDDLEQLRAILPYKPTQILLDNFSLEETRRAVALRDDHSPATLLESSGGLTLDNAADYGATGVDSIAVGALTHSVTVLDLGLD